MQDRRWTIGEGNFNKEMKRGEKEEKYIKSSTKRCGERRRLECRKKEGEEEEEEEEDFSN